MTGLLAVHDRLNAKKLLGPAARLGANVLGVDIASNLVGAGNRRAARPEWLWA